MLETGDRLGLIGDIHAEDDILQQVLGELTAAGVDRILSVGDIADGPGSVDRCCTLLEQYRVEAVAGNHDRWLLSDRMRELVEATPRESVTPETLAYLGNLPSTRELDTKRGKALLCHGLGANDMAKVGKEDFGYALETNDELQALIKSDFRFVLNGHTHDPGVLQFDDLTVIGAGTLKIQHAVYLICDFEAQTVECRRLSSDAKSFRLDAIWPLNPG